MPASATTCVAIFIGSIDCKRKVIDKQRRSDRAFARGPGPSNGELVGPSRPDTRCGAGSASSRPVSFRLRGSRTRPLGRGRFAVTCVFPETKSADERIGFVAFAATRRGLLQLVDVAASDHDVLWLEGGDQACDHVRDMSPPFLLAVPLQSATADIVLVGSFPV